MHTNSLRIMFVSFLGLLACGPRPQDTIEAWSESPELLNTIRVLGQVDSNTILDTLERTPTSELNNYFASLNFSLNDLEDVRRLRPRAGAKIIDALQLPTASTYTVHSREVIEQSIYMMFASDSLHRIAKLRILLEPALDDETSEHQYRDVSSAFLSELIDATKQGYNLSNVVEIALSDDFVLENHHIELLAALPVTHTGGRLKTLRARLSPTGGNINSEIRDEILRRLSHLETLSLIVDADDRMSEGSFYEFINSLHESTVPTGLTELNIAFTEPARHADAEIAPEDREFQKFRNGSPLSLPVSSVLKLIHKWRALKTLRLPGRILNDGLTQVSPTHHLTSTELTTLTIHSTNSPGTDVTTLRLLTAAADQLEELNADFFVQHDTASELTSWERQLSVIRLSVTLVAELGGNKDSHHVDPPAIAAKFVGLFPNARSVHLNFSFSNSDGTQTYASTPTRQAIQNELVTELTLSTHNSARLPQHYIEQLVDKSTSLQTLKIPSYAAFDDRLRHNLLTTLEVVDEINPGHASQTPSAAQFSKLSVRFPALRTYRTPISALPMGWAATLGMNNFLEEFQVTDAQPSTRRDDSKEWYHLLARSPRLRVISGLSGTSLTPDAIATWPTSVVLREIRLNPLATIPNNVIAPILRKCPHLRVLTGVKFGRPLREEDVLGWPASTELTLIQIVGWHRIKHYFERPPSLIGRGRPNFSVIGERDPIPKPN